MDAKAVRSILKNAQPDKCVFPEQMTQRELGVKLFEANASIDECPTPEMRRGWLWASRASAWADAAAYLVSQGQEVSL